MNSTGERVRDEKIDGTNPEASGIIFLICVLVMMLVSLVLA
jgi:hypothetical protein